MIVKIIRDKDKFDIFKGKKVERIDFDGDVIFPFYLNCLSIKWTKDGIAFHMLDDYEIKYTHTIPDKMFIIGDISTDKNTINRYTTDDALSDRELKYKQLNE